jgi:hypothetical protein
METRSLSQTERLIRRKGIWHYRRRVPNHLTKAVGRREIHQSLGTSNLKEARRLRTHQDLVWDSRFQTALGGEDCTTLALPELAVPLSTPELLRLMQEYVAVTSARDAEDALTNPPADEEECSAMLESVGTAEDILKSRDDIRAAEWVHGTLIQLASGRTPPSADAAIGEIVRRGLLELERRKLNLLENLFDSTAGDLLFARSQPNELTFGTLAEQFLVLTEEEATANRTNRKWVDKQKAHVSLLVEMVGKDTLLR